MAGLTNTKTINDLNSAELIYIFKFLSVQDVRNCSQTCLRWRQIITPLLEIEGKA